MEPRMIIKHLVGIDHHPSIELLASLREENSSVNELSQDYGISRQAIYTALNPLEQSELVVDTDDGYEITAGGAIILDEYTTHFELDEDIRDRDVPDEDVATQEALGYLTNSKNRIRFLRAMDSGPITKMELANDYDMSRSTVSRVVNQAIDRQWVRLNGSHCELTGLGKSLMNVYNSLETTVESVDEKGPFLRHFPAGEDIPIQALRNSEMAISTSESQQAVNNALEEIHDEHPDHVIAISSEFSRRLLRRYRPIVESGARINCVIDADTYRTICKPKNFGLLPDFLKFRNVDVFLYPESTTIGVCVLDGEAALVGVSPDHSRKAAIYGTDEALINWATALYDDFHSQALPPSQYLTDRLLRFFGVKLNELLS